MSRIDGRNNNETREIKITRNYVMHPQGSVLIECGNTKVICTATIDEKVPPFLKGTGEGWITCEYGMLPGSTQTRKARESSRGKVDGRTAEIQRLIGRALRSVVDLKKLGERTIWIDCDVIQADGGTRTASITGAFVALVDAINKMDSIEKIDCYPIKNYVAAISVGIAGDEILLDLCYEEDSSARVDMNVIMTDSNQYVEIQGTGEESPFTKEEMGKLLELAEEGISKLISIQRQSLGSGAARIGEVEVKKMTASRGRLIIASNNAHKIEEIRDILGALNYEILSLKDAGINVEIEENGSTFEENSYIKARAIYDLTKEAVLADDSGLEVYALDGAPGVYSARFAGEHGNDKKNNNKLLELLKDVPEEKRGARFACAIVMLTPEGKRITGFGYVEGRIGYSERGSNGFGYDPLFIVPHLNKTFAELASEEKNSISHRKRALEDLKGKLKGELR